jgi:hypothetical protein
MSRAAKPLLEPASQRVRPIRESDIEVDARLMAAEPEDPRTSDKETS